MKEIVIRKREDRPSLIFVLLSALLVFFGCVYLQTISLSLFRVVITRFSAAALTLVSLLAAIAYGRFLLSRPQIFAFRESAAPSGRRRAARLLIALALIFLGLLWLVAYLVPDTGFDGLWYHNPTMHLWALKGYPHWIEGGSGSGLGSWGDLISQRFNGWPKGIELMGLVMVRATGLSRLLNSLNLPFLALGVISIVCLARFFGSPPGLAWLGGFLFLFVPVNIVLSQTTLIDPAASSCYVALMALTALSVSAIDRGEPSLALALPLGCALGLSIGAKGPGIVLLPLVTVILAAAVAISGRRRGGDGAGSRFCRRGALFILIAVLIAVLCGSYWHLRNWFITGSPVYPIGVSLGGRTIFPGITLDAINPPPYAAGTEDWSQLRRVIFSWLENLQGWRESTAGKDPKSGGLGVIWILGCLPAIIAYLLSAIRSLFRRGSRFPLPALPFFSVLLVNLVLFFAMPPHHNHKARYVIWLYGLGLPVFAAAAGRISAGAGGWKRQAGLTWIGLAAVLMVGQGLYAFSSQVRLLLNSYPPPQTGKGIWSRLAALSAGQPSAGYFWPYLRDSAFEEIFGDGKPAAIGPLQVMAQPILGHLCQYEDFGERKIYFIEPALAENPESVGDYLRRREVRYVIWQQGMRLPAALRRLAVLDETVGEDFRLLVVDPGRGEER